MSDSDFIPKGDKRQLTDKSNRKLKAKNVGGLKSKLSNTTWGLKNEAKRIDSQAALGRSHVSLGQSMFDLEMMTDKIDNIQDHKDKVAADLAKDLNTSVAEAHEAAGRIDDAKRKANLSKKADELAEKNLDIKLKEADEKLNPKPGIPYVEPEPESSIDKVRRDMAWEEEMIALKGEQLEKFQKMRDEGVSEEEIEDLIDQLDARIARERQQRKK